MPKTIDIESRYEKTLYQLLVVLVFLLPLIVLPAVYDIFSLPKITLFRLVILGILAAWLFKAIFSRRIVWRRTPLDVPIITLAIAVLLSTISSIDLTSSLLGLHFKRYEGSLTWFSYFIIFFAASNHLSERKKQIGIIRSIVIASTLISIYAIAQHSGYDIFALQVATDELRSSATFGNPVFLAAFLVLAFPLALALFLEERQIGARLLWLSTFVLNVIALALTYTRGAWVGGIVALGLVTLSGLRRALSGQFQKAFAVALIVALLTIASGIHLAERYSPQAMSVRERISSAIKLRGSVASRLSIWNSTLFLVAEKPVQGWGLETFRYAFSTRREKTFGELEGTAKTADRPHNQILYLVFSAGALGLFAYLWIVGLLICSLARWLGKASEQANQQTSQHAALVVGLSAACLGYLVQEQFSFSQIGSAPLFWILLGITFTATAGSRDRFERFLNLRRVAKYFLIIVLFAAVAYFGWWNIRLLVADHYYLRGQRETYDKASEYYRKALLLNPWETTYRFALGESYNALAASEGNLYWLELARRTFTEGTSRSPRDYEFYFGLGNTYYLLSALQKGEDYSLAKNYYLRTIKREPFFADSYIWLGKIYLLEGNYEEALKVLKRSLELDPQHIKALDFLGQAYEAADKPEMAKLYYKRILEIEPGYEKAKERLEKLTD